VLKYTFERKCIFIYNIVVWYNPNNNSYYYRKHFNIYNRYDIGYKNGYGHEIVLIIDLCSNEKISLKRRIIDNMIRFLKNIR